MKGHLQEPILSIHSERFITGVEEEDGELAAEPWVNQS